LISLRRPAVVSGDRHSEDRVHPLSYLVGRQLRAAEIVEALGVSRSAYYLARDEGRLVTADNLIRPGTTLRLNPVDLMLRYGLISETSVLECAREFEPAGPPEPPLRRPTAAAPGCNRVSTCRRSEPPTRGPDVRRP
jgi:hypothetical protein